jgi:hypothetical protein
MTQYPEGKSAYSPRLLAPKPPIINIPTTPNSAVNRAGTGLKNPDLDHRMEYFDPKTRPQAIVLDEDARKRWNERRPIFVVSVRPGMLCAWTVLE